jgi:hypothetical protein
MIRLCVCVCVCKWCFCLFVFGGAQEEKHVRWTVGRKDTARDDEGEAQMESGKESSLYLFIGIVVARFDAHRYRIRASRRCADDMGRSEGNVAQSQTNKQKAQQRRRV